MHRFNFSYEPSIYSLELFDSYFDELTEGYLRFESNNYSVTIDTLKAMLILFITFPKKALEAKGQYARLEAKIRAMRSEDDFQKTCIEIFDALSDANLYIDLYKTTFIDANNNTNTKIVKILRAISRNIIDGYEKTARRLMFMFYLSFRHRLDKPIDDVFLQRKNIYEINKEVMSKADEIGLFIKRIPHIEGQVEG